MARSPDLATRPTEGLPEEGAGVTETFGPARDSSAPSYDYLHFATFKCVSSYDGGRTWQARVRLAGTVNEPSLWNALYVPRSGNVLALAGFKGKIWSRAGVVKQE